MAGNSVKVSIIAETRKFHRAINQLKNASGFNTLKNTVSKVGKAFTVAAAAATASSVAITGVLWKAGETAGTSNARITQVATSMGLFGEKTDQVSKKLINYAEQTARQTGLDQNAIKATQAKLLTFANLARTAEQTGGAFDRATAAAVDLAAAGFGTAESNAVQLGKALNDPIKGLTALTRSGITFTQVEKEKIVALQESGQAGKAQELILAAIEKQVGGTATATANASDKFKIFGSQILEHLGAKLVPVFDGLADKAQSLLPTILTLSDKGIAWLSNKFAQLAAWWNASGRAVFDEIKQWTNDKLLPAVNGLAATALPLLQTALSAVQSVIATVIPIAVELVNKFIEWKDILIPLAAGVAATVLAFETYNKVLLVVRATKLAAAAANAILTASFLASPVGWFAAAIGAVVAAVVLLYQNWDKLGEWLRKFGSWLQSTFGNALHTVFVEIPNKVMGYFSNAGKWLWDAGQEIINGLIGGITDMAKNIWKTVKNIANDIVGGFKSFLGINSPSKVMRDTAMWIPVGIAEGISAAAPKAVASVKNMGERLTDTAKNIRVRITPITVEELPAPAPVSTETLAKAARPAPAPAPVINNYSLEVKTLNANEETGRAILESIKTIETIQGPAGSRGGVQWI